MLASNFGQIEASTFPLDIMELSSRAALNITFAWWMERIDHDEWDKQYKHLFTTGQSVKSFIKEQQEKIAPAKKGQEGSLNIPKREEKQEVEGEDLSKFFGRMGHLDQ